MFLARLRIATTTGLFILLSASPSAFAESDLLASSHAKGGIQSQRGQSSAMLADPSAFFADDGTVEVYGTGVPVRYRNRYDFVHNIDPKPMGDEIKLINPNGSPINNAGVWDFHKFKWTMPDGKSVEVLSGGMCVTPDGKHEGEWPKDNISRRSYTFSPDGKGHLVRSERPIFGTPAHDTWIGHTYGRHPLADANGQAEVGPDGKGVMYYEKISRVGLTPLGQAQNVTEVFARKFQVVMKDGKPVMQVDANEQKMIGIQLPPGMPTVPVKPTEDSTHTSWVRSTDPAVSREDGNLLIEGPRVLHQKLHGKDFYIMGFSSGDFASDHYGTHFAVATTPMGPFKPITNANGNLKDFGAELKSRENLSWVGRPFLWSDPQGRTWLTFHAVEKGRRPKQDYSRMPRGDEWAGLDTRTPLTVPVDLTEDGAQGVKISLRTGSGTPNPALQVIGDPPALAPSAGSAEAPVIPGSTITPPAQ